MLEKHVADKTACQSDAAASEYGFEAFCTFFPAGLVIRKETPEKVAIFLVREVSSEHSNGCTTTAGIATTTFH